MQTHLSPLLLFFLILNFLLVKDLRKEWELRSGDAWISCCNDASSLATTHTPNGCVMVHRRNGQQQAKQAPAPSLKHKMQPV